MQIISLVRRMEQTVVKSLAVACSPIPECQIVVLSAIAKQPNTNQTQIVQNTKVDRSTVSDVVRRLLRQGLVVRSRSKDDAREYRVNITTEGKAVLKQAMKASAIAERDVIAAYPFLRQAAAE